MSSNSDDTGMYSLYVTFKLDTDGDMDSVKVQNNVAIANASLPSDVQEAGVTTSKASSDMAYLVSLYSPKGTYDTVFLKNYADIYLIDKIKRVKGVGGINIFGADYSMSVSEPVPAVVVIATMGSGLLLIGLLFPVPFVI